MYKAQVVLGVVPTKRGFLPMDEAKRQKDMFMKVVRGVKPDAVKLVDVDDICENGIAFEMDKVPAIVDKLKKAEIDALFIPFCDFGEESVVAAVASAFCVPVLVWGNRDETVNTAVTRGRDTQCGMFAATKVLRRHGVKFSYIFNCETQSEEFRNGLETFIRTANILKDLDGLRIAKIGERPGPFMSVMTNEANLIKRFGITTVPISPSAVANLTNKLLEENGTELQEYYKDVTARMDASSMEAEKVMKICAATLAVEQLMLRNGCSAAAIECWPGCIQALGVPVCMILGELTDRGMPVSCETDVNGAITMAIMRAALLGEQACFLADLTIRHPQNDNAELLWHCGPFPYSLKASDSKAALVGGQENFELRQGELTLCRFDDIDGEYYLFAGEGRTTTGPATTGTYVWMEVDCWKKWEERLMYGPYIHHIGGMYGKLFPALREAARYLDIKLDHPDADGPKCL
ncbi:MAG: fucose isomerase [Oscillospiraceae bacterium]|nr:fucose isomerase [Oscillospiraceae bacterium]